MEAGSFNRFSLMHVAFEEVWHVKEPGKGSKHTSSPISLTHCNAVWQELDMLQTVRTRPLAVGA